MLTFSIFVYTPYNTILMSLICYTARVLRKTCGDRVGGVDNFCDGGVKTSYLTWVGSVLSQWIETFLHTRYFVFYSPLKCNSSIYDSFYLKFNY